MGDARHHHQPASAWVAGAIAGALGLVFSVLDGDITMWLVGLVGGAVGSYLWQNPPRWPMRRKREPGMVRAGDRVRMPDGWSATVLSVTVGCVWVKYPWFALHRNHDFISLRDAQRWLVD